MNAEQSRQLSANNAFPLAYNVLAVAFIAIFTGINAIKYFFNNYNITSIQKEKLERWRSLKCKLEAVFNINLIPTTSKSHAYLGSWTYCSIIFLLFVLSINIGFCLSIASDPHHYSGELKNIKAINVTTRIGCMSIANLPLLFLLAGRNSILQRLTGFSYHTLRSPHRIIGLIASFQAIIHSFASLLILAKEGRVTYNTYTHMPFIQWGIVGLTGMLLLVIFSSRVFRLAFYDTFLWTHVLGASFTLLAMWFHATTMRNYIYAGLAFWIFDYIIRAAKRSFYMKANQGGGLSLRSLVSYAEITYINDALVIRVPMPQNALWEAGVHAYVTFLGGIQILGQSHPFSIANTSESSMMPGVDEDATENLAIAVKRSRIPNAKTMLFIAKVRNGATKWLVKQVLARFDHSMCFPISLDMIYGSSPLHRLGQQKYERLVLIAAGSGISHTLSILGDIVAPKFHDTPSPRTRPSVRFLWIIRSIEHLNWVASSLYTYVMAAEKYGLDIQFYFFITNTGDYRVPASFNSDAFAIDIERNDSMDTRMTRSSSFFDTEIVDKPAFTDRTESKIATDIMVEPLHVLSCHQQGPSSFEKHHSCTDHTFCTESGVDCRRRISRQKLYHLTDHAKSLICEQLRPKCIHIAMKRPDLSLFLCDAIKLSQGKTLVSVCGPESLTDTIREQVYHLGQDYDLTLDAATFTA